MWSNWFHSGFEMEIKIKSFKGEYIHIVFNLTKQSVNRTYRLICHDWDQHVAQWRLVSDGFVEHQIKLKFATEVLSLPPSYSCYTVKCKNNTWTILKDVCLFIDTIHGPFIVCNVLKKVGTDIFGKFSNESILYRTIGM